MLTETGHLVRACVRACVRVQATEVSPLVTEVSHHHRAPVLPSARLHVTEVFPLVTEVSHHRYVILTETVHTLLLLDFVRKFYKCYQQAGGGKHGGTMMM